MIIVNVYYYYTSECHPERLEGKGGKAIQKAVALELQKVCNEEVEFEFNFEDQAKYLMRGLLPRGQKGKK